MLEYTAMLNKQYLIFCPNHQWSLDWVFWHTSLYTAWIITLGNQALLVAIQFVVNGLQDRFSIFIFLFVILNM